jgi:hypothetical protein
VLAALLAATPARLTHGGAAAVSETFIMGDRYVFDAALSRAEGWYQYDTDQDAWYFGIWYNPDRRLILTYAEGDVVLVACATLHAWNAEIADMARFYGAQPPAMIAIDAAGAVTHVYDPTGRPGGA